MPSLRTLLRRLVLLVAVPLLTAPALAAAPGAPLTLSLPGLPWALEIRAYGFRAEEREIAPDGRSARLYAENYANGALLSAFIEPAPEGTDAPACRELAWSVAQHSPLHKEEVRRFAEGPYAAVEYLVREHAGVTVDQRHLHAWRAEAGHCIEIHLSKAGVKAGEPELLRPMLTMVRIDPRFLPGAADRLEYGNHYFGQRRYDRAIDEYEAALALEQARPALGRGNRIVLTDQLGMAYGLAGQLDRARDHYLQALEREPGYPLFHYNLACTYAELGEPGQALAALRAAAAHRDEALPGESLPDPLQDRSFRPLLQDAAFRKAVEALHFPPSGGE